MTCSVVQNTSPVWITKDFAVTDNGDGTFTVASVATPDIALNKSNVALKIENNVPESIQLNATVVPAGTAVTWTSSSTSVATVDNKGKVTAAGTGTTTITATITVSGTDYTDTCAVTVSEVV